MSGTVEAGNKIIVSNSLVSFWGKPKDLMTRLEAPIYKGYQNLQVGTGLNWEAGDQIYFAPTNLHPYHAEYRKINSYDAASGSLIVDETMDFYHYGGRDNSADYNGVDMRGEVINLSRNVKVIGDDSNDWGCAMLAADRIEADRSVRVGEMVLDNVEVYHGGQEDTYKSAIRYEGARLGEINSVTNTVAWGGNAKNLIIKTSQNVSVSNSAFIGGKQVGVILQTVQDVHVDNIIVAGVERRITNVNLQTIDKEAGLSFCSFFDGDKCFRSSVTNSIAFGNIYAGFVAPGHACGESSTSNIFRDNVSHSNDGSGAHIFPNPAVSTSSTCYEGSNFSAYSNKDTPLTSMYTSAENRFSDMTFINSYKGFSANSAGGVGTQTRTVRIDNIHFFGETDNDDCPENNPCFCSNKFALMIPTTNEGAKPLHPDMPSQLPIYKIKSEGVWGGQVFLSNLRFTEFKATLDCSS